MFFIDIRNKVGDREYYFSQDGRNDDGSLQMSGCAGLRGMGLRWYEVFFAEKHIKMTKNSIAVC